MKAFLSTLTAFFLCMLIGTASAEQPLSSAIVKIYAVYTEYDYDMPWRISKQQEITGSGCIIDGKRILTNAHVVANQRFIQVKHAGEAKKFTARVEYVAHDCDLALLTVSDDSFFNGVKPLTIGNLPNMQDRVAVFGFPEGGDELCITEGVVSRIEYQHYAHSAAYLLACQIDAAINPGNSGGPVIKDREIAGIAFQKQDAGEMIGYIIPAPVIHRFLKDIGDGTYHGVPSLEGYYQSLENPALRARYHLNEHQTGILVTYVPPGSPMEGTVKQGDVILAMDGKIVENDGTIAFRDSERIDSEYLVHNKLIGDSVQLRLLRDGRAKDVDILLTAPINAASLVPFTQYDKDPTYYILGGLVFQPLTENYLARWPEQKDAPASLVNYYVNGRKSKDQMQVIVLTQVLGDEMTAGYGDLKNNVFTLANGARIASMKDLVHAVELNTEAYHVLEDEYGNQIVLDPRKVGEANQRIMKKYDLHSDRSDDLRKVE